MKSVLISAWHPAVNNAVIWLRQHLNTPGGESIDHQELEEYFGCHTVMATVNPDKPEFRYECLHLEFEPVQATAFLLRWS